jgi:transposase
MVENVVRDGDSVVVEARGAAGGVACPECATVSRSVHGRYWRRLVDTAVAGSRVLLRLLVRRFRCRRGDCETVTFAEQFDGLTVPHARYSPPAHGGR